MALNLNDPKAIDYSSEVPYFPFDTFGTFDMMVLEYHESGEAGSEQNKSDKEFDVATVEILASSNEALKKGDKVVFWFQTGGDGVSQKNRAYKSAELRQFVAAASGVDPTGKEYRAFDAGKARKDLLAQNFEAKEAGVRLSATKGKERTGAPGTHYTDKAWKPLA